MAARYILFTEFIRIILLHILRSFETLTNLIIYFKTADSLRNETSDYV